MGASFCSKCGRPAMAAAAVPTPLYRPRAGRAIAGVCAGFALRYGWDVVVVRLVAVLGFFLGGSFGLAYVIAWIVMPEEPWVAPPPGTV
jgi:phage shock protein C